MQRDGRNLDFMGDGLLGEFNLRHASAISQVRSYINYVWRRQYATLRVNNRYQRNNLLTGCQDSITQEEIMK